MKFTVTLLHEYQIRGITFDGDVTIYTIENEETEGVKFCVDSDDIVSEILDCFYHPDFPGPYWDCSLLVFFRGERISLDKYSTWRSNGVNNNIHVIRERPVFMPAASA